MGEVGHEGRSSVTDNLLQKPMVMPDMFQKQVGNSGGVQGGDGGDSVGPLRQMINDNEDGVLPLGVRKLTNHVNGDTVICQHLSGTLFGINFPTF